MQIIFSWNLSIMLLLWTILTLGGALTCPYAVVQAYADWLSPEPWKCQFLLITMMDQAHWIPAFHAVYVDGQNQQSLLMSYRGCTFPHDRGLQSEAAAPGLTSLLQSSSVRLKPTRKLSGWRLQCITTPLNLIEMDKLVLRVYKKICLRFSCNKITAARYWKLHFN